MSPNLIKELEVHMAGSQEGKMGDSGDEQERSEHTSGRVRETERGPGGR